MFNTDSLDKELDIKRKAALEGGEFIMRPLLETDTVIYMNNEGTGMCKTGVGELCLVFSHANKPGPGATYSYMVVPNYDK